MSPPDRARATVGIIGGSGLYDLEGVTDTTEVRLDTPYGAPSDVYVIGTLGDERVAFLPRHGKGHRITPTELNSRANVYGFKLLGVQRLISVSAVGSLREEIAPLDIVIPDQLFDRTSQRANTFFGNGIVAHVGFADPFCPSLSGRIADTAERGGARIHRGGTYVCIEGPQFSTKAESRIYRSWGVDIIGMTAIPEAKLAREAEICYATIALVTDYDVWHTSAADVTVEMVVANLLKNVATARAILSNALPGISTMPACSCQNALKDAIMTRSDLISSEMRREYAPLIRRYFA